MNEVQDAKLKEAISSSFFSRKKSLGVRGVRNGAIKLLRTPEGFIHSPRINRRLDLDTLLDKYAHLRDTRDNYEEKHRRKPVEPDRILQDKGAIMMARLSYKNFANEEIGSEVEASKALEQLSQSQREISPMTRIRKNSKSKEKYPLDYTVDTPKNEQV